jgi:MoxR-like ATPase
MDALSQFLTPTTSTNTTSSDDLAHFFGDEPQAPEETKAPEVKAKTKAKAKAKTKVAAPLKVEDERRTEIADEWIDSDAHATTYKQFVEYINSHVVGEQAQMACTAILLGAIARQNTILTGPPGTGKSYVARLVANLFEGANKSFLQLSAHTPVEQVLGSVSMKALDEDKVQRNLHNSILNTNFLFLDEVEKADEAVHHAMLSLLAEREVYDDGQAFTAHNIECITATRNYEIEDQAMADRFSLCVELEYAEDAFKYHQERSRLTFAEPNGFITKGRLSRWQKDAQDAISKLRTELAKPKSKDPIILALKALCGHSSLSSLWKRTSQRKLDHKIEVIGAMAALNGRSQAQVSDLWATHLIYLDKADQNMVKQAIQDCLKIVNDPKSPYPFPTMVTGTTKTAEQLAEELANASNAVQGAIQ